MPDPSSDLAREWLIRSEHDLRVAQYLLTMPDPFSCGCQVSDSHLLPTLSPKLRLMA